MTFSLVISANMSPAPQQLRAEEPLLWEPSTALRQGAQLTEFIHRVNSLEGLALGTHEEIFDWSIRNPERFWSAVADFSRITFRHRGETVIEGRDRMPGARWFPGSTLNYAENLLRFANAPGAENREAIVAYDERGLRLRLTYAELAAEVARYAALFRATGLGSGDVVASYLHNGPEAVIAMLAATSIGAVWTASSPNFLAKDALLRFSQSKPKILLAPDGYLFNGKSFDVLPRVREIADGLPALAATFIVGNLAARPELNSLQRATLLTDALAAAPKTPLTFAELPAEHPVYIMYSSGTTGAPKCLIHGAIGLLLEHNKEYLLHTDLRPEDRMIYCTTGAWMMWQWLVGSLAVGSTVALYDGSFLHSDGKTLLNMLEQEQLSVFGTSAAVLQEFEKRGLDPKQSHNLPVLRLILSTGSRLRPGSFDYVYRAFPETVQLSSIWGGTDLCGCFGLGTPLKPVRRGELQSRSLGLDVRILRQDGAEAAPGETGEVVCCAPFPSMPVHFLDDPDGTKYRRAYFEHFSGKVPQPIWRHGDSGYLTRQGGIVVLGRSDDTLNPGGIRIGPIEVTDAAERVSGVLASMAVGQDWKNDERIILYVQLAAGVELTDELRRKIISEMPTPSHRPKKIIAVPEFPTTKSGKLSARAIRDYLEGQPLGNEAALDNLECLAFFKVGELEQE